MTYGWPSHQANFTTPVAVRINRDMYTQRLEPLSAPSWSSMSRQSRAKPNNRHASPTTNGSAGRHSLTIGHWSSMVNTIWPVVSVLFSDRDCTRKWLDCTIWWLDLRASGHPLVKFRPAELDQWMTAGCLLACTGSRCWPPSYLAPLVTRYPLSGQSDRPSIRSIL